MDEARGQAEDVSQTPAINPLDTPSNDALVLTDTERLILDLYAKERELELERSLLEARQADNDIEQQLIVAEREALEARAAYLLRNKIVDHVLVTDPVIKAVHAGSNASYAEKRLLPLIHERDVLSMTLATLTSSLTSTNLSLQKASQSVQLANKKNQELAKTLLDLAERNKAQTADEVPDENLRGQIRALEEQVRDSRRKWRTLKSIVAGVIVGSGVDWATDEKLRELVLDDEDYAVRGEEVSE
ncbi:uncharacterized protein K452DRAFT_222087 [Aplosporella prunicola CBS 121167]|uniref:Centromere protein H C-terminal domain-containing protein n=1 Tax=Aplosporella prunicola CBS 121167 TaxID=1176127 RepID=A0A6A6BQV7_9PEZI|nr:uncharacterized protein K452DRAFT_222087 [Aplosporella prunicola CBS 121167]KAF2144971.1 hypothetical protein K452DRAFT_222087 [Aplosporella prunicola CBS 121167]